MSNARLYEGFLPKGTKAGELVDTASVQSKNSEESFDDNRNSVTLKFLYASLFATILEDTITEMRILNECNNKLCIAKTLSDIMLLRTKKFGIAQPVVTGELDKIAGNNLNKDEYKLDKLAADRNLIYDTIIVTYMDLSVNRCFPGLAAQIKQIEDRDNYYANLEEEEAGNRVRRRELVKQLRVQRNHITSAKYDVHAIIDDLKTQVEDANLKSEANSRYVTNWERSRTEQHNMAILEKEDPVLASIVLSKQKLDNEQRVHSEATLLLNISINETMEKVEDIMTKYDLDIEAIDLKTQIMKNNYQKKLDLRMELEARYAKREKESRDWLHFKEERENACKYREMMNNAAVVAQAWWRGLMVRLQLGPYKPQRRKPPPPPSKEKKMKTVG